MRTFQSEQGKCVKESFIIIEWPGTEDHKRLVASVLEQWPDAPQCSTIAVSEIHVIGDSHRPLMVWLITGKYTSNDEINNTLDYIAGWHVPVMITRSNESLPVGSEFRDGVVIAPPDSPISDIALILQSLATQGLLLQHVHNELTITRRHHGGLRGEMEKLDEELRLAANVQAEFLPTDLPKIGDVQVASMYKPAGYVSGDIYDVQRLDEDHIGFWIADVVGHGVPAALMTMFIRQALKMKVITDNSYKLIPPNQALAQLNKEMVDRETKRIQFATACYGLLNCMTHQLQFARAGHPLPMLLHEDGTVEHLDADGPLLGVFPDENFQLVTRQLDVGDRLLFFSDGFELAYGEPDEVSLERYLDEFQKLSSGTPKQALAHLEQTLEAQPGSLHQQDDLTVIMLGIGCGEKITKSSQQQLPQEHYVG